MPRAARRRCLAWMCVGLLAERPVMVGSFWQEVREGHWPFTAPELKDPLRFIGLARKWEHSSSPLWQKVRKLIDPRLVNLPGAKMKLAGSYLEGTAVQGSDMDVWIYTDEEVSTADRSELAQQLCNNISEKELKLCGVSELRPQKKLIGRKAIKIDLVLDDGDVLPLDIVLVNISKDVGFDDHELVLFTGCDTRAEARSVSSSFIRENEQVRLAVRAMKALCSNVSSADHGTVLPGFLLNNLARRLVVEGSDEKLSALEIFKALTRAIACMGPGHDVFDQPHRKWNVSSPEDGIIRDLVLDTTDTRSYSKIGRLNNSFKQARHNVAANLQQIEQNGGAGPVKNSTDSRSGCSG
ncbi:unnamed protein product [Durusdinium trenchii]|uniref:Polymerase nucleotidyl transferase domain-containing protein n=1 Tax=Durusdinium trenchii TaxID=1381693 RepID=A0ABP0PDI7_9DINO